MKTALLPVARDASQASPDDAELARVLMLYTEQELIISFIVIEPGRHRIRKLAMP